MVNLLVLWCLCRIARITRITWIAWIACFCFIESWYFTVICLLIRRFNVLVRATFIFINQWWFLKGRFITNFWKHRRGLWLPFLHLILINRHLLLNLLILLNFVQYKVVSGSLHIKLQILFLSRWLLMTSSKWTIPRTCLRVSCLLTIHGPFLRILTRLRWFRYRRFIGAIMPIFHDIFVLHLCLTQPILLYSGPQILRDCRVFSLWSLASFSFLIFYMLIHF